jgi:hypothetical protein
MELFHMYDSPRSNDRSNWRGNPRRPILLSMLGILCSASTFAGTNCVPADLSAPICLSGTVLAPGYDAALVQHAGETALTRLQRGDAVGDWQVDQIGPGYVLLTQSGRTLQVKLSNVAPSQAEAAPPLKPGVRPGPLRQPRTLAARGERPDRE